MNADLRVGSRPSRAGEADIVGVQAVPLAGGTWRFNVTVAHGDTGWDHYADRWEVLAPDGSLLGTRVLLHPHEHEQPFTRSLGGVAIPAGSMLIVRFASANRDERLFDDAENMDICRHNADDNLAFGQGVHFCIGAPLARQELNLGFLALLDRFEHFTLAESDEAPASEASFILRNLPRLDINYTLRI